MIYHIGREEVIAPFIQNSLEAVSEFTDSASHLREHDGMGRRFVVPSWVPSFVAAFQQEA